MSNGIIYLFKGFSNIVVVLLEKEQVSGGRIMKVKIVLVSVLMLIIGSISCSAAVKVNLKKQLVGTSWNLVSISGDDVSYADITLSIEKKEINGFSGVNRYFGNYRITGNRISVSKLGMTRMAGDENLMDIEQEYAGILENVKKVSLKQDRLTLMTADDEYLEFVLSDDNIMY